MLHIGHFLLFKRIKDLFPNEDCHLIVAVQDSDFILKYKPNTEMIYNTEERLFMVGSLRFVDEVVLYRDVDIDIKEMDFDVFVKGPDQCHDGFNRAVQWCENTGKQVITLPRTEGISSSLLRNYCKV